MKTKTFIPSAILVIFALSAAAILSGGIRNTKHNLSSGGPIGDIKSGDTSMICIFCHTPHISRAAAPMWNRETGEPVYTIYNSSTLYSTPGQPDGTSKLCLSCHDGTIALGRILSRTKEFDMRGTSMGRIPPAKPANLGSDLSDDHPISFNPASAVSASPDLRHPAPDDRVRYGGDAKLQCTSCHNPHENLFSRFLVKSNRGAAICKTCHHIAGFNGISTHDIRARSWNGQQGDPWPHTEFTTVRDNSCMNCHRNHGADGKERLLNAAEEDTCLTCHNGNMGKNIQRLMNRTSSHRVDFYRGIHDPVENILTAAPHAECSDCHNPHRLNSTAANAPHVNGRLAGVSGMSVTGGMKTAAQYEYEVCLKCHGQDQYRVTTSTRRMFDTGNLRTAVNPSNESFHAVAAQGKRNWVPSLVPPYTTSSRLYCTDCHNSDASTRAGGSGPNGPHGSKNEYLLERQYVIMDHAIFSEANYALCFKCHNPITLLDGNISGFPEHGKHIRQENTPCAVCHDPHGSPNYPSLLNFNTNAVFPNGDNILKFEIIGNRGYCYLDCHGKSHGPESYERR